jgi:hypothetical protein
MKNWFLLLLMIPAFAACVSRSYERDTVVERPNAPAVVVPQGSTGAPPNTTVVVPQNSPAPAPSRDTTVIVPR